MQLMMFIMFAIMKFTILKKDVNSKARLGKLKQIMEKLTHQHLYLLVHQVQ